MCMSLLPSGSMFKSGKVALTGKSWLGRKFTLYLKTKYFLLTFFSSGMPTWHVIWGGGKVSLFMGGNISI